MNTFLDDLATYLATHNIGVYDTDDETASIFIGNFTGEGNQVVIRPTGGVEPYKDIPIPRPTVQILVRNSEFGEGEALARSIYNLLHGIIERTDMGDTDVMRCMALQEPSYFEQSDPDTHLFITNYEFMIRP